MSIAHKLNTIAENEQRVYDGGFEAGEQAYYKEWWNSYISGIWSNYNQGKNAFSSFCWNDITFKPPLHLRLKVNNAEMFFREARISDIGAILKERDVEFDFSKCPYFAQFAYYSTSRTFPSIDISYSWNRPQMFDGCSKLVTIEKLIFSATGDTTSNYNMFNGCSSLENIVIEGLIGSSISFSASPLTIESCKSVINALKDYSGTTATYTLTLSATSKEYLTDNEIAQITQKGWTLA